MFRMAESMLETENCLGRETRLPTENSSYMNLVKDEFSVLNLSGAQEGQEGDVHCEENKAKQSLDLL